MKKNNLLVLAIILALVVSLAASPAYSQCSGKKDSPCGAAAKVGCGNCDKGDCKNCGSTEAKPAAVEAKAGNVWKTVDGKEYYTCPVMGQSGLVSEADSYSMVKDVKYYHCCPACLAPFRADPAKYLKDFALPANISSVDDQGAMRFRDPVSGEDAALTEDAARLDLDGMRYFFVSKKNSKENWSR